ncbi:MAG: outer membrane protein assembly factor BamD [Thermodesulfobacteriota bacterium]
MSRRICHFITVIAIALIVGGCPSLWNTVRAPGEEPTPELLFKKGKNLFDDKKYQEAIQVLESLKSAHPDFENMPEVYMKLADASFEKGAYDDAASRFKQFLELYPNHEDTVRAKYMVGMCYFNQIKRIDLDSTALVHAAEEFKTVVDRGGESEWKKKAEEKYRECRKRLGEKELYKAQNYLNQSQYRAARLAAQRVLDEYKDLGLDDQAKAIVAKTEGRVPKEPEPEK